MNNDKFRVFKLLLTDPFLSQKQLAISVSSSLGKINKIINELRNENYN